VVALCISFNAPFIPASYAQAGATHAQTRQDPLHGFVCAHLCFSAASMQPIRPG
jgi:hypothetical protein